MANKATQHKRRKKTASTLLCAVLIIAVLLCGAYFAVNLYLDRIDRVDENQETIAPSDEFFDTDATTLSQSSGPASSGDETSPSVPPENTTSETSAMTEPPQSTIRPEDIVWSDIPAIGDDELLNIMLVGQDRQPGETRTRTDTMILVSVNPKTGEISVISFLRDLYVQIPGGYSDNRLNQAYCFGGFPLLYDTMNVNFGVSVDGGFEVDFDGFIALVDLLGGIDIEITAAEARGLTYSDPPYYVSEGMNHMDGGLALAYSRLRSIDNDFNRTGRQRTVVEAMFKKLTQSDVPTILSTVNAALPLLTTDMSNAEIIGLATTLAPLARDMEISSYMVPASDCYQFASIRDMSVLLPDLEKIRYYLENEYLPFN